MKERIKVYVYLLAILISIASMGFVLTRAQATEPDYDIEFYLSDSGEDDVGTEYQVTRNNTAEAGYIRLIAYESNVTVRITLENIRGVVIYFNATDIDISGYMSYIQMAGVDVDITVESDVSLLDGEFHGIPEPDGIYLNGESWEGDTVNYNGDTEILTFTNLEMSENTITLNYMSDLYKIIPPLLTVVVGVAVIKLIYTSFNSIGKDVM